MLKDVVEVRSTGGHQLFVRFEDGAEGTVDFEGRLRFEGVFAPLRDPNEFAKARVDPHSGTVVWPTGADLDPDVLYSIVTGRPLDAGSAAEAEAPYVSGEET